MADLSKLLERVLNDSNQAIQVRDLETFSMLYANQLAIDVANSPDKTFRGVPCYKFMMGFDKPCPFCPYHPGEERESFETEVEYGDRILSVKCQLTEWMGRKVLVEYAWDVTSIRRSEKIYEDQVQRLMKSIPMAQGIFHFDLTADKVLGLYGVSKNMENFTSCAMVDETIFEISKLIPDEESRKNYRDSFCRNNLQKMFADGNVSSDQEFYIYFDDGSIRPCRTYVRLLVNPKNFHLECVFYGLDISREKQAKELQQNVVSALSRDFMNVYLVNPYRDELTIVKLDGYLPEGLDFNPEKRFNYSKVRENYVRDRVHPEEQDMMMEVLSTKAIIENLKKNDEYLGTYRVFDKGETHYYQYKYVKVAGSDEVVAGFQNVDSVVAVERKRQEELTALLDEDRFRRKVFGTLAQVYFCVYYLDLSTYHFVELSKTSIEPIKKYIGESGDAREKFAAMCDHLIAPEYVAEIAQFVNLDTLVDRLMGKDYISIRYRGAHVDWCEGYFVPVDYDRDGRCSTVLWVVRSVQDEVAKEEAYKERLQLALRKAEQASAAKSNFLTRMSHDIRTPLDGIIGILDLMDKREMDSKLCANYRQKARIAASHLLALLNDVLEMSKLEDSDTQLVEEPFNLWQVLYEVFAIANLRADENSISITTDDAKNLKYLDLFGSPLYIRQIFLNILTNCIKYNKMGGTVYCYSELVRLNKETVTYCFHVKDTGIGMKSEFLEHLFDPFSQERSDARSTYQGTGMGMAFVKRLVEKMRGSIVVESDLGKGSHFAVTIPFRINRNPVKCTDSDKQVVSLSGMKVLLVEDNDLNMEIARNLLEDMGIVVTCVTNGEEAVRIFEQMDEGSLDLILMDLMMPVLDGYGATKKIRLSKKKDGPQIPIIALSANAFVEDILKSREAGMNDHIAKPIDINQLKRVLTKYKK